MAAKASYFRDGMSPVQRAIMLDQAICPYLAMHFRARDNTRHKMGGDT